MAQKPLSLLEILEQANLSKHGISLTVTEGETSQKLRRKLYGFRERLRVSGVGDFDRLSFIVRTRAEILIVKRPEVYQELHLVMATMRPLSPMEAPSLVRARGKTTLRDWL